MMRSQTAATSRNIRRLAGKQSGRGWQQAEDRSQDDCADTTHGGILHPFILIT